MSRLSDEQRQKLYNHMSAELSGKTATRNSNSQNNTQSSQNNTQSSQSVFPDLIDLVTMPDSEFQTYTTGALQQAAQEVAKTKAGNSTVDENTNNAGEQKKSNESKNLTQNDIIGVRERKQAKNVAEKEEEYKEQQVVKVETGDGSTVAKKHQNGVVMQKLDMTYSYPHREWIKQMDIEPTKPSHFLWKKPTVEAKHKAEYSDFLKYVVYKLSDENTEAYKDKDTRAQVLATVTALQFTPGQIIIAQNGGESLTYNLTSGAFYANVMNFKDFMSKCSNVELLKLDKDKVLNQFLTGVDITLPNIFKKFPKLEVLIIDKDEYYSGDKSASTDLAAIEARLVKQTSEKTDMLTRSLKQQGIEDNQKNRQAMHDIQKYNKGIASTNKQLNKSTKQPGLIRRLLGAPFNAIAKLTGNYDGSIF